MQRAFDAISVQMDTKYVECAPTHIFGRALGAMLEQTARRTANDAPSAHYLSVAYITA